MASVSNALGMIGTLIPVLALILLIRGPLSRYFALFLFLLSSSATGILQGWVFNTYGASSPYYFRAYWGSELLIDLLFFFLVIWLTARALEGSPHRAGALKFLGLILVIALAVPFLFFQSPLFSGRWNSSTAQLLNFGAAIMNLGLWSALLMSRNRDRQLFTVSAGLGVSVAGAALLLGVHQLTSQGSVMENIARTVYRVTEIISSLIWCWAFWPHKKKQATPPPPTSHQGEESPTPSVG